MRKKPQRKVKSSSTRAIEDGDGEWVDPLAMETLADDAAGRSDDEDGKPVTVPEDEDDE